MFNNGFFGKTFDLNKDGKMSYTERLLDYQMFKNVTEDEENDREVTEQIDETNEQEDMYASFYAETDVDEQSKCSEKTGTIALVALLVLFILLFFGTITLCLSVTNGSTTDSDTVQVLMLVGGILFFICTSVLLRILLR